MLTANSFLMAAKRYGSTYIQDCAVTDIIVNAGKVTGVQTTRRDFSAPVIVNAAGAWAGKIAEMAGVTIPLDTWTHDVAHIRRPAEVGNHPTVIDSG